jgi:hypothetical protein
LTIGKGVAVVRISIRSPEGPSAIVILQYEKKEFSRIDVHYRRLSARGETDRICFNGGMKEGYLQCR